MFTMVKKSRNGEYLQVCQNYRDAGRVRQRLILYVGPYQSVEEALTSLPREVKNLRTQATKRERADYPADAPDWLPDARAAMIAELRDEADQKAARLARLRELCEANPQMVANDAARAIRRAAGADARAERKKAKKAKKAEESRRAHNWKRDAVLTIKSRRMTHKHDGVPEYVAPFRELQEDFDVRWARYLADHEPNIDDFADSDEYRAARDNLEREHVDRDGLKRQVKKLYEALPADQRADLDDSASYLYDLHLVADALRDLERGRALGTVQPWEVD
jgi:hypothetical protein